MQVVGKMACLVFGISIFFSNFSYAETELRQDPNSTAAPSGAPRKQSVDFEDELVEGELKKPELFYLLQKKQFNYKRLIKLRENFVPEMARDSEKIPSGGGQ